MTRIADFEKGGRENCCGCGTCALICPKKAITMKPLELGCLYPAVDDKLCVDCGICIQFCAFQRQNEKQKSPLQVYAASARDTDLLYRSSSGGVFAVAANHILASGGVVSGCSLEYQEHGLMPMHIWIDSLEDLVKLQGSKYVQSTLGDIFAQIRTLLRTGKTVLFSGTPCQVDSLKWYLRTEDTSRLYTMDLVCHGVPSAKLFRDYLASLKKNIHSFSFREKYSGWGKNGMYSYTSGKTDKEIRFTSEESSYYSFFLKSEICRESCYACKYANTNRVGDLTVCDFWGFEQEHPELLTENGGVFDARKGISAILVNSPKGHHLLQQCGSELIFQKTDLEKVTSWNRQLREPCTHTGLRNALIEGYERAGYKSIEQTWRQSLGLRYYVRMLRKAVRSLPAALKRQ